MALTSAGSLISQLDENEPTEVKENTLKALNQVVDQFWSEISEVETIKKLK